MENATRIIIPEAAWADKKERVLEFPKNWEVKIYPMKGYSAPALSRERILHSLRNPIGAKPLRKLAEDTTER